MNATIAAVIPTRHRADLALNAVRSLKDQGVGIDIYVSDNSASPEPLQTELSGRDSVTYLRPPAELAMPEHWNWALEQALARSTATHFTVHYDRKFSKPGHWDRLAAIAEAWPDRLIAFPVDHVSHVPPPLRLWQTPWTGRLYEVATARVAALVASGRVEAMAHCVPVLSNCLVPRPILERIADRFRNYCQSTGPDSAFMSRFLALEQNYLFDDQASGIVYASDRSNGLGYLTGKGGDFPDFIKTLDDRPWLDAAPLPGVSLGQNMLYHEYELVRAEVGDRLPPLELEGVLAELAASLRWVTDPNRKAELWQWFRRQGYRGRWPQPLPPQAWRSTLHQIGWRWRMRRGQVPPHICGFAFPTDAAAIEAALLYPRQRQEDDSHVALLQASVVGRTGRSAPPVPQ
jgi:hypothetical protein